MNVETEETVETENTAETEKPKEKKPRKKKENEFEKKYNELNDTYLRMLAEYDNYRKRTQKEKDGMFLDGISKTVQTILPVIDNLDRALMAETSDAEFKNGVEMIKKQFITALETLGVKEIDCLGKEFDPNMHNAIMHIDDESYGENEIIEVFQKGYMYKEETIIRHAIVKVAN
ncbi:MAG: nucleotide exchange factor GrpE [Clostridia bacterium]|nr:nucleotide exchange factor GrpE [Clostridia bacterium]